MMILLSISNCLQMLSQGVSGLFAMSLSEWHPLFNKVWLPLVESMGLVVSTVGKELSQEKRSICHVSEFPERDTE